MPDYGNVPPEDIAILSQAAQISAQVAGSLPSGTSHTWREQVYDAVLGAILRDWVRNGTDDLKETDVEDLANLVLAAHDVAKDQPLEWADRSFPILLRGALDDWVENWNEP